jgi:1,2-diacylglycerol-3-alpha-glucose alpha-1,2-glucosyltransferase
MESRLHRSGIGTSTQHQRTALGLTDFNVVSSPWNFKYKSNHSVICEFDIAHCNLFGPYSVLVAKTALSRKKPLILHAHVTAEDFADSFRGSTKLSRPLRSYLRWFYSQADRVICPSNYTKNILQSYPIKSPISVMSNGVDVDSLQGFESLREDYRSKYDLSGLTVFSVGNVFERKGLTTFCTLAQSTNYNFVWFGPYETGPIASPSVKKWTRINLPNLTFTGWIPDKRGAYAAGDIFCFPSKVENQGISVLEAMACGKAVVLSDIPVFEEYYTHGKDCLMCHSIDDFKNAIDLLHQDDSLYKKLCKNAQKTANKHTLNILSENLEDIYVSTFDNTI